ncbi:MDR family MFS transporter [Tenggerimyces flavus]|uniref:MDR family MFS transporter n=1 Tax=Tenggerimyces flavus TaxID=1708749 RepID=A0ABV7Y5N7_9ACTN|nr:MDR family MFS transporter [Tenggerimyces flavus]MBM7791114.1 EmrB/QacA subfamily drug resistance transporter [Tenggerimyces flavus]
MTETPGAQPQAAPPQEQQGPNYLSHKQILVVLGGLMAGMLLAALDQSIVGVALPRIVSELGGLEQLSWVVTAYLLTNTASTPLWGKISDLYGRRSVFQVAIVIFLIGSVLAALATNMPQLIGFRALQGLGAGGLMALSFAIIGDVIPPRERGRYMGYFGAVFGVSSVAGPLLGGFFTDGPGWRWIFWINVPIGIGALLVTSWALKLPKVVRSHKIDYLGAATIVASVSLLLLYLTWRGQEFGWTDGWALAMLVGAILLAGLFVFIESRAAEPIIPLRLFRNPTFTIANVYGLLAGIAMFGAIVYLPIYLQVVKDLSPTASGLAMLPMVAGIFTSSISSGQIMTRTGRYKIFPILGGISLVVAMYLLSTLHTDSSMWLVGFYQFLVGFGLGFSMQVLMTATQNSVEFRDMGTSTGALTFFRSMGGAVGTAVFGAVLTSRLATHLTEVVPGRVLAQLPPGAADNVQAIKGLPPQVKEPVLEAFVRSLHDVFLTGIPFVLGALIIAFFLKEIPLATGQAKKPEEAEELTPTISH